LPSPWGYDNSRSFQIYANASADDYECPAVVTDKSHSSCGQSRFGCWTCTVVKEDKSMSALIRNGETWMKPLLDFRNKLAEDRNVSTNRSETRRNGQNAITEDGFNQGNYTAEYRARILRELLALQKEIQKVKPLTELITNQELIAIQVYWYRDGIFDFKVGEIFAKIYGRVIDIDNAINEKSKEKSILKNVCKGHEMDYELINNLLTLQHSKTLLLTNYGLQNDIETRIEAFVKEEQNANK
jgi:DNA sulfur modification protein DndC